jgi:two-component system chemotaxis sensor kinase CheA
MIGADTELDKRVIEQMVDPLMHIIRNAIDHGLELPDVRKKTGKPETGQITLAASQEGSHVIIRIIDDGKGLDRDKIISKAISSNLIRREDSSRLTDEQVWDFIFAPGFSTTQDVTEVSGRGVGMDVVRKNVEKINGDIKLISVPGEGTEFTIRIPLTLAIIPSMLVKVGNQVMALPLDVVVETTRIFTNEIGTAEGFELIPYRQKTLPIIRLSNIFKGTGAELNPKKLFVVVVKIGEIEAGIAAESLLGQQDVVVKPLSEFLTEQPGFAGATIMGDGSIGLILDLPSVFEKAKLFILKRQQFMEDLMLQKIGEETITFH